MTDKVRINGVEYSWTSVDLKIGGVPYDGILSIDFGQSRKRAAVYGARKDGRKLGRTAGKYETPGLTIRMLTRTFDILTTILTPLGLGSYGDAEVPIFLQYVESPTAGLTPVTITFSKCAIDEEKESLAEGIEASAVDVTFDFTEMRRNGKQLWSLARSVM